MATSPPPDAPAHPSAPARLYKIDGYTWARQQAAAVCAHDHAAIDWEHVAEELEGLASGYETGWVGYCARTVERLLKIEHFRLTGNRDLRHWRMEVGRFRSDMADLIEGRPGLQSKCEDMCRRAWRKGRQYAVGKLTERLEDAIERGYHAPVPQKLVLHYWDRELPRENPYRLEHVTAFDRGPDRLPNAEVFPPGVAVRLNTQLGTDYEIRRGPARDR